MTDSVDWDSVWKSLTWDDSESSDERIAQQLRQRAQQYAAPLAADNVEASKAILTFMLGDEHYGIDVLAVRGVRSVGHITRVPGVPAFYRGVVNVRGTVITVLDLRVFFDMIISPDAPPAHELIVARANQLTLGLLAHHVEGVMVLPLSQIESVDHVRYADGVTADRLVLLNVERLFEDPQLIVGGKEDA